IEPLVKHRVSQPQDPPLADGETDRDALARSIRAYFEKQIPSGEFIAWISEARGEVVATSGLVFWHRPPTSPGSSGVEAYIMNMYTVPEWRGRGLASRLFEEVIEYVRSNAEGRVTMHDTES